MAKNDFLYGGWKYYQTTSYELWREEPMYSLQPAVMVKMLVFAFAFVELCSRLSPAVATSDAP